MSAFRFRYPLSPASGLARGPLRPLRPLWCRGYGALLRRCLSLVVGLVLSMGVVVAPAWAHGGDGGAVEGYVLVQQALGHLAADPGPKGVAMAEAKVGEMLSGPDQDGVDVAMVGQAQAALSAGQTAVAQQRLQQSITDAVGQLKPATGEQTGTTVVGEPLAGRAAVTGLGWTFGGASLLLLVAGVGLAVWFRPAENMAQLRRRLAAGPAPVPGAATTAAGSSSGSAAASQDGDRL